MPTLADLHRAVQSAIAGQRLGRPVFVRYLLRTQNPESEIISRLVQLTACIQQWLNQPWQRIYALGSLETGQVSITLQFLDGAAALVSYVRSLDPGNGVDLMVLGNHGALYHETGNALCMSDNSVKLDQLSDPETKDAIERSLKSGKPEVAKTRDPS